MRSEYRVVWKRVERDRKVKRYASRTRAERWLGLLTSDEPWRFFGDRPGDGPDDYECCSGAECGCGGLTNRERAEEVRATLPPIEYARIEERPIAAWRAPSTPEGEAP